MNLFIIKFMELMTATKTKILTKQKVALILGISSLGIAGYLAAAAVVDMSSKINSSAKEYNIELDYPEYLNDYWRHPQKYFSGRDIKIIKKDINKIKGVSQQLKSGNRFPKTIALQKRDKLLKMPFSKKNIETKKQGENYFAFKIPEDIDSGYYTVDFQMDDKKILFPIEIENSSPNLKSALKSNLQSFFAPSLSFAQAFQDSLILFQDKKLGCLFCSWELVFKINPNDENYGYLTGTGSGKIAQTNDGWQTDIIRNIDEIVNSSYKFMGDPKITFNNDGKFSLVGVVSKDYEGMTGGLYPEKQAKSFPFQLSQIILKEPRPIPSDQWNPFNPPLDFDYPKIATDASSKSKYFGNTYIIASARYFSPGDSSLSFKKALFTIDKAGTITKRYLDSRGNSIITGPDGEIYIGFIGIDEGEDAFKLIRSFDGGQSFSSSRIQFKSMTCANRISSTSNKAWIIGGGPELAIDKNSGRLYAVWADWRNGIGCLSSDDFEYNTFAINNSVYLEYSDDKGATWSSIVRVDDDNSGGDQGFPSIAIDDDGIVYVAFLDHRDNRDLPQFDVYFARSFDRGRTFSKNIRVNKQSIPNYGGGRDPGDYLDMIAVGKTKIFVAYPCVNMDIFANAYVPSDACVAAIAKPSLNLKSGWNFISLPFEPQNPAIEAVLESIKGKYEAVYSYDETGSHTYNPSLFSNDLKEMHSGYGYKIKIKEDATLMLKQGATLKSVLPTLHNGWNWIGVSSTQSKNISDLIDTSKIAALYIINPDLSSAAETGQPHWPQDFTQFESGRGYALRIPSLKGLLDYNDDNIIDKNDWDIISQVMFGAQKCLNGKICDLNQDGKISIADVTRFGTIIQGINSAPDFNAQKIDYNNNYTLDSVDSGILINVFLRKQTCPSGKICDVNQDGKISVADQIKFTRITQGLEPVPNYLGL